MRTVKTAALLVLVLIGMVTVWSTCRPSKDARTALRYYLDLECDFTSAKQQRETEMALQEVLKFKADLQPSLEALLTPDLDKETQEILQEVQRNLEKRWKQRQAFLEKRTKDLKPEELKLAKGLTKDAYVKQGREQVLRKYREKSVIALAAIGTPEAWAALDRAKKTGNEELQKMIEAAAVQYKRSSNRGLHEGMIPVQVQPGK